MKPPHLSQNLDLRTAVRKLGSDPLTRLPSSIVRWFAFLRASSVFFGRARWMATALLLEPQLLVPGISRSRGRRESAVVQLTHLTHPRGASEILPVARRFARQWRFASRRKRVRIVGPLER